VAIWRRTGNKEQRQLVTISPLDLVAGGSEVMALIPALSPAVYIGGETFQGVVGYEKELRLQRGLERIALQLTADAGFDPWQPPEAWRRLRPKDLPRDIESLAYTPEGKYQLSILKLQYQGDHPGPSAGLSANGDGNSVQ
jgi:hypothetical protein